MKEIIYLMIILGLVLSDSIQKPNKDIQISKKKQPKQSDLCLYNMMGSGGILKEGSFLESGNGYYLVMRPDGVLALYTTRNWVPANIIWQTRTKSRSKGPFKLIFSEDGQLVILGKYLQLWKVRVGHKGVSPYHLALQQNGDLVIYDVEGTQLWKADQKNYINRLRNNMILKAGEYLSSGNGYYAIIQHDGNFVVYMTKDWKPSNAKWASYKYGANCYLKMQGDGNLVVYNQNHQHIWNSNTANKGIPPYQLIMQTDGNLVVYDSKQTALWHLG